MLHIIKENWRVAHLENLIPDGQIPDLTTLDWIPAAVPQSIHYDLVAAGRIGNVYASLENMDKARWISHADWVYTTTFDLDDEALAADSVELSFGCIDTFSDVFLNGVLLGSTDNMFFTWKYEIPASLRRKENELIVHIKGHRRMVADKADENVERIGCYGDEDLSRERTLVRRYQRSYNYDFMGNGVTCLQGIGILRDVTVCARSLPAIDDVVFAVLSATKEAAELEVQVLTKAETEGLTVKCELFFQGQSKLVFTAPAAADVSVLKAVLPAPALWWPHGDGDQPLYQLKVGLLSGEKVLDCYEKQVGIRSVTLKLKGDVKEEDFQFFINHHPVYIRGANWVPVDMLNAGGSKEECERLLQMCLNANVNLLRLWGGGMEEEDWFYQRCDELGLMIWEEARMHSHTYPDYDQSFIDVVCEEAKHMVTHLRSHPCFVLFSGGNEQQEGWDDWNWQVQHDRFYGAKLLYEYLPEIGREYCPEIPYISNSPYGKKNCQSPVDGDTHTWGNFYNATEDPLFVSETCWHNGTLSRAETLEELCGFSADDFTGLRWHHRFTELTGNKLYQLNQYSEYHEVGSLREYLHGLEVEQMRADYTALFYLRTRSPSCRGIIYWPLNKGGPMQNYGCIDYHGRPLMPYYGMVRLFRHAVVHIYRDGADLCIVAANSGAPTAAKAVVTHRSVDGRILRTETFQANLPTSEHIRLARLENWYADVANRWREYVHVRLDLPGELPCEDAVYFCPFCEVEVPEQLIGAQLCQLEEKVYKLTLKTEAFAKVVEIETNAKVVCSDNYFAMQPGDERVVIIRVFEELDCPPRVTVRSLDNKDLTIVELK